MGKKSVFCNFDREPLLKNLKITFIVFIGQKYVGEDVFYDSGVSSRKSSGQPRLSYQINFSILTLKNGISNVSDDQDIKQKVYVHGVGLGYQWTSLGGGIESPNMHLTPWEP